MDVMLDMSLETRGTRILHLKNGRVVYIMDTSGHAQLIKM